MHTNIAIANSIHPTTSTASRPDDELVSVVDVNISNSLCWAGSKLRNHLLVVAVAGTLVKKYQDNSKIYRKKKQQTRRTCYWW